MNDISKKSRVVIGIIAIILIVLIAIIISSNSKSSIKHINAGIAQLKRTFSDHKASIWKVEFSPDGKLLASCSIDSTVIVRENESGQVKHILKHPMGVTNLVISPDGNYIVTSSYDEKIRIWNLANGGLVRELIGHEGTIWALSISPDNETIASGGEDKSIRLWNLENGALKKVIPAHERNIWSIKFSPDGLTFASSSFDNDIKLWDANKGSLIRTLSGHSEAVVGIAFNNNGNLLASAADDATIKIWNVADGKVIKTLVINEHQHEVAFSPDGKRIIGGGSDKPVFGEFLQHIFGNSYNNKGVSMRLWDVASGQLLQSFAEHANDVNGIAYSHDGKWIASASADQTICLWQVIK